MNVGVPLIVIVVFLVIWVVTNVVRAQQEDAKGYKRNPTQPARPSTSGRIEQNSGNDIERFLAEIDRLRKKPGGADNPTATSGRPAAGAIAASKLQPKPKQQKQKKQQLTRRIEQPAPEKREAGSLASRTFDVPQPRQPSPPPLPSSPADPAAPVNPAGVAAPKRVVAPTKPSDAIAAAAAPVTLGISAAILSKKSARDEASPAMRSLEDLLKSAQGPSLAILLQEIMGKPKSQRKE